MKWKAPLIFIAAVIIAIPMAMGLASRGEGRIYDILLRESAFKPSGKVCLIALDDKTFNVLGRAPNRAEIAVLIDKIWQSGADLIGLDLIFNRNRDEVGDAKFEEVLTRADCVLAFSPATPGLNPVERFRRQAVGLGSVDLVSDPDGVVRSIPAPAFDKSEGQLRIMNFPMALKCSLLYWFPADPPTFKLGENVLSTGNHRFHLAGGRWLIPYCGGDGTLPRTSMIDILNSPGKEIDYLKGKIVLIGNTRPTQHDLFSVPIAPEDVNRGNLLEVSTKSMAGMEIHGQALSAMLQGYSIRPLTTRETWFAYLLLAALASVLAILSMKPFLSLLAWFAGAVAIIAFGFFGLRMGMTIPLLGLTLTWLFYAAISFSRDRYIDFMERQAVSRLFARYVSPNIAKTLLHQPELVHLGGKRKELSILFSDIRGFTSLSENLQPEEVSALLNEYFTEMTRVLFSYDGTLDKFIGDAILAFFGDPVDQPDHAQRALACAVSMQEKAEELRERFREEGKPELRIGISVHTGPVIVGNNGSVENFMYTVIGDAVNLTSRLQGLAVEDDVIVSQYTASLVKDLEVSYNTESCEPVRVKGKSEPIEIVRVLSRKERGGKP